LSTSNSERGPEETVRTYLKAMQAHEFGKAFDVISTGFRAGKTREVWAKEQKTIMEMGEVKIFGFKVYPAIIDGDKAKVPDVLKSQDKFLNKLGLDEYEVYDLIKESGEWRVDDQFLVQTPEQKAMYFPEQKPAK